MFTLRKLELAMPFLQAAQEGDPKAMVNLAALNLADDATLKLMSKGNTDSFQVFVEQAYDMDDEEVAEKLANFTEASVRFSLRVSGFKPDEINKIMAKRAKTLRESQPALQSPDESQE